VDCPQCRLSYIQIRAAEEKGKRIAEKRKGKMKPKTIQMNRIYARKIYQFVPGMSQIWPNLLVH
jgi:hypothetical protein